MYIEPNISALKKFFYVGSTLLCVLFLAVVIFGWYTQKTAVVPDPIKLTGTLQKEDGVFRIDNTILKSDEPLDAFVSATISIIGALNKDGLLVVRQVIAEPQVADKEPALMRATSKSGDARLGFSLLVKDEWEIADESTDTISKLFIYSHGYSLLFVRSFQHEYSFPFEYAEVDSVAQDINGFAYERKRVIISSTNTLTEIIEPSEVCRKDIRCPQFYAHNGEINPITSEILSSVLQTIVFLPEPQGWKLFNYSLPNSEWDFSLMYPEETMIEKGNGLVYTLRNLELSSLRLEIFPADLKTKEVIMKKNYSSADLLLTTRKEKVYTHNEGNKSMVLRTPDDAYDVVISGTGAVFEAVIRTLVFKKH